MLTGCVDWLNLEAKRSAYQSYWEWEQVANGIHLNTLLLSRLETVAERERFLEPVPFIVQCTFILKGQIKKKKGKPDSKSGSPPTYKNKHHSVGFPGIWLMKFKS